MMSSHLVIIRHSSLARTRLDLQTMDEPIPFFFRQEPAGLRAVGYKEDGDEACDDGQQAFNDEDPGPGID